ncbi:MAG: hypothetical protein FWH03_00675 [Firmicutes bacterium]|nr:hypothetical protein [Bacillota bacterium]
MAKEIVFSTSKFNDYHFFTEYRGGIFESSIGQAFDAYVARDFIQQETPIVYIVRKYGQECLIGAYLNINKIAQTGGINQRYANCQRGGKPYPSYAFVGWCLDTTSREFLSKRYISLDETYLVSLLKYYYDICWDDNLNTQPKIALCKDKTIPQNANIKREFLAYPEIYSEAMLGAKTIIPLTKNYGSFVFNQAVNFALSIERDISFCIGFSEQAARAASQEFHFVASTSERAKTDWLDNITMKSSVRRQIEMLIPNSNVEIDEKAQRLSYVVRFAVSRRIRLLTIHLVTRYLNDLKIQEDGFQWNDLRFLKALALGDIRQYSSDMLHAYFLPFLCEEGYIKQGKENVTLTRKGVDVVNYYWNISD